MASANAYILDHKEYPIEIIRKNNKNTYLRVKDGKIIAKSHNEVLRTRSAINHAEIKAIQIASKKLRNFDLSGCELYTTGKPCPMCSAAIKWAKIQKVYYGCDYEDAKVIGFDEASGNSNDYSETQIDNEECKSLYAEYLNSDHRSY